MGKQYSQLNAYEREEISRQLVEGISIRKIARFLDRSPSTISREITRNATSPPKYRAAPAGLRAIRCSGIPRRVRKLSDPRLWGCVCRKLRLGWSPEQISAWLKRTHPSTMNRQVSHETIYCAIYIAPRGELRSGLIALLRHGHTKRRPRSGGKDRRGQIPDMVPISERPAEVEPRIVPGHWEADLIKGKGNGSAVGTVIERTSRLVILAKMEGSDAQSAYDGFTRKLGRIPEPLRKTLTYDRGKEMALHADIAEKLSMDIYFADPHSPWQRGAIENANGLIRQYLPKGTDLSVHSQAELNHIAYLLNTRPRKCLNWETPLEVFSRFRHQSSVAVGS